jgi:hypothetical protein
MDTDSLVAALELAGAKDLAETCTLALEAKEFAEQCAFVADLRHVTIDQAALLVSGLSPEQAAAVSRMVRAR